MKIAEVSERYGISSDTLRYYERIGLILPVNRSESGIRDYNEIDVRRVEFIKCMRSAGLPIETLIEYVGLVRQGDGTIEARKLILKEQRELLAGRMKEMLWVDTQITSTGEDRHKGKYCEYILPYPSNTNFELIGKVLSFRGNAEILEPAELKREWTDTIRKMYESVR